MRTRAEKEALVEEIRQVFEGANSIFLVSLTGLTVNEVNELRANLRQKGARVRVVKNRLAKRAAADSVVSGLEKWFVGPTAVVYHPEEPVTMAKALVDFAKDHPQLEIKAGLIDRSDVVDGEQAKAISKMPDLDGLRAQILSLLQAPAGQLVRLLNTPATQLARVLEQRSRQEGQE